LTYGQPGAYLDVMDGEDLQHKVVAPRWQARIATTLAAWLVAFLVVTALLRLFGDQAGEGKFRRNEDPLPDEPLAVVGLLDGR
jgi:hypothetical protein